MFVACDPPAQPAVNELVGTLADGGLSMDKENNPVLTTSAWTGGAGQVTVFALSSGKGSETSLASTALESDGKFSFAALPTPAASLLVPALDAVPENCTQNVVVSDAKALATAAYLSVTADKKSGTIAQIAVDDVTHTEQISLPFYVDRDVTLKGQQTCAYPFVEASLDVDAQFRKGWNTVVISQQISASETGITVKGTIRKGSLGDARWYLTDNAAQPLSLNGLNLPFSR